MEASTGTDASSTMEQFKTMMARPDGTSKFVALFLLLKLAETDPAQATAAWQHVDYDFLEKLVLAREGKHTSAAEALDLQQTGCAILHTYAVLGTVSHLPTFYKRASSLIKLYATRTIGTAQTKVLVGQALESIAATPEGAVHLLSSKQYEAFATKVVAERWEHGCRVLTSTLSAALATHASADLFSSKVTHTLEQLAASLLVTQDEKSQGHDEGGREAFAVCAQTLTRVLQPLDARALDRALTPTCTASLERAVRARLLRPSRDVSEARPLLGVGSCLVRARGVEFLLTAREAPADAEVEAKDKAKETRKTSGEAHTDSGGGKCFVLACGLAAAEIRSSLAELASLTSDRADFHERGVLVAGCFDIARIACLYLVTTEQLRLAPDQILQVRDHFSGVFGETISYLRDRFDRSTLNPASAWHASSTVKLDASPAEFLEDPTVISGTQSLCLWLQEDESLHEEASGIMDVLLALVRVPSETEVEYGAWVPPAILALLSSDVGLEQFRAADGIKTARIRLDAVERSMDKHGFGATLQARLQEAYTDLEILRHADAAKAARWEDAHMPFVGRLEMAYAQD